MAGKETAGPRLTTSSGSCNVDLGTSSAATDLNHGRCTSSPWHALQDCVKFDIGCTSEPWEITGCTARTGRVTMAGKETARPYLTMSGGSFNVGQGTSSAASDLDFGRNSPPPPSVGDEATVAQKETARPYFTMSSGHCHLAQGTSSAPSDLDESRNPEGAWELPLGQHGNQAANTTLVCFQCRITFAYEEDFHDHMINHLTGRIPEGARELPLGQQENLAADANLVCFKCGIAFNFSEAFQDHMTNHMIGMPAGTQQAEAECEGHYAGSSSNTCRACGKVFTEKWSLQRHLLTHTGSHRLHGPYGTRRLWPGKEQLDPTLRCRAATTTWPRVQAVHPLIWTEAEFPKKPEKQRGSSERTRLPTESISVTCVSSVSPTRRPWKSTSLTTGLGKTTTAPSVVNCLRTITTSRGI
ncbi:zinc finger protein 620-like isoform X5 [Dermacentor albipictus]|uniref:zinc finger protein 620-like isoform X5 n=1 Tax=Dermacentor albipictus TaxID=60249 RepID=UPI0038FCE82C